MRGRSWRRGRRPGASRHPRPITRVGIRTRTGGGYATARRSYGLAARTRRLAGRGRTGTDARPPTRSPARRRTGYGSEREHAARSGRRRAGLAGRRAKQRARRPARRPPLRPFRPAKRTPPASDHENPHRPPNPSQGPSRGGRFGVRRVAARPLDTRGTRPRAPRTRSGCGSARPPLGGPAPRAALEWSGRRRAGLKNPGRWAKPTRSEPERHAPDAGSWGAARNRPPRALERSSARRPGKPRVPPGLWPWPAAAELHRKDSGGGPPVPP